jgi:hypothetical protein
MASDDMDLRSLLETLDPKARDDLRRVLIRYQADRDAIASQLMRYRDERGDGWADIIDMLTMHPVKGRLHTLSTLAHAIIPDAFVAQMEQASREGSRVLNPAERLGRSLMWSGGPPHFLPSHLSRS